VSAPGKLHFECQAPAVLYENSLVKNRLEIIEIRASICLSHGMKLEEIQERTANFVRRNHEWLTKNTVRSATSGAPSAIALPRAKRSARLTAGPIAR
jgi:precorrin-4 methylase